MVARKSPFAAVYDAIDKVAADVKALDVDGVAGDLIENLEGHLASARMRVGNIADRISNHNQKEG